MTEKEQQQLSLGFSPCPNDTWIFNGLVHGKVACGLSFAPPLLEDVESLNAWARVGRLDVSKISFHALGHVLDRYTLLTSGAALGRACGPLLISADHAKPAHIRDWRIAIPGKMTTAALLLRLYQPECRQLEVLRFDQIIEAVASGRVDAGVIIHESRFTYQEQGLHCVQDLGAWWEEQTSLPIPLGCIVARSSLPESLREEISAAIRASIVWADTHPEEAQAYIRQHAQEMDPAVMLSHIRLYVNDFSKDLGQEGLRAVDELLRRGSAIGLFAGRGRLG